MRWSLIAFDSQPLLPITWIPMQVHHGQDVYDFVLFRIQNSVWESSHQRTPHIIFNDRPSFRTRKSSINSRINFNCKIVPQTSLTFFLVFNGLNKFRFCFWMEGVFHEENLFEIFLNTSSPGTAWTCPERSSAKRSLATATHFLSISDSGGLRLFKSESTTMALPSTGSDMASAIRS